MRCPHVSVSVCLLSSLWKHPCVHPFIVIHPGCSFPKKLGWREAANVICWVCCSLCSPVKVLLLLGTTQAELLSNPVTLGHDTSPLVLLGTERKNLDFSIISMQKSYKTLPSWSGRILHLPAQRDKYLPLGLDSSKSCSDSESNKEQGQRKAKCTGKTCPGHSFRALGQFSLV